MNNLRTAVLLAAISGLLIAVGGVVGGMGGVVVATVLAGAMNFGSYWFSADVVLRSSHAVEIERKQDPRLFNLVEEVVTRAGMPMVRVYVMETAQPNAFATGRNPNHAAVAVTTGIREMLSERELRAVLGHELAHVSNRDILLSSMVATIASAISMISWMSMWFGGRRNMIASLVVILVAPMAAGVIQAAVSRSREFEADHDGAQFVGDPMALASALAKIERGVQLVPRQVPETTAHLYIASPFGGLNASRLFSTHPSTAERIRRLEAMSDY
jgi:heat shock protein HtpX